MNNNKIEIGFIRPQGAALPRFVYRYFRMEKGQGMEGHKHMVDHPTLVARGAISIKWGDGREEIVRAPAHVIVPKDALHHVKALEDDTIWYCVFELPEDYTEDQQYFWESALDDPARHRA